MAPMFRVEMLPARHGDCLLLSYGDPAAPRHVLIDGGPNGSYETLAARLKTVARLELLVVTHIDNDHIGGIVKLMGDDTLATRWEELWFNGWEQITRPLRGLAAPRAGVDAAAQRSALEGHHLAERAARRGCRINGRFDGAPLCVASDGALPEVTLDGGLRLVLLSPDVAGLKTLRRAWDQALTRTKLDPDDPAALAARLARDKRYRGHSPNALSADLVRSLARAESPLDEAAANGSSIAVVAEYAGRRVALLGDAHAPVIEAALRRLARQEGTPRVRLDALKLAHHGSKGNLSAGLLKAIDCARFLVSTDGSQFDHPDDEALALVVQHTAPGVELHFNHRNARTARWGEGGLQGALGHRAHFPHDAGAGSVVDLTGPG